MLLKVSRAAHLWNEKSYVNYKVGYLKQFLKTLLPRKCSWGGSFGVSECFCYRKILLNGVVKLLIKCFLSHIIAKLEQEGFRVSKFFKYRKFLFLSGGITIFHRLVLCLRVLSCATHKLPLQASKNLLRWKLVVILKLKILTEKKVPTKVSFLYHKMPTDKRPNFFFLIVIEKKQSKKFQSSFDEEKNIGKCWKAHWYPAPQNTLVLTTVPGNHWNFRQWLVNSKQDGRVAHAYFSQVCKYFDH